MRSNPYLLNKEDKNENVDSFMAHSSGESVRIAEKQTNSGTMSAKYHRIEIKLQ